SGLWTALRTRPYSKVPAVDATPSSIFVTAIDTHPLAADPAVILQGCAPDFENGLRVLARLAGIWLCKAHGATVPGEGLAGVGTRSHLLEPLSEQRRVWHINYQDVVAVGRLFTSGQLSTERVVALAGPQVERPRLVRTRLGVNLAELTAGEMKPGNNRVISGS